MIKAEQIISYTTHPYHARGGMKPLWKVCYIYTENEQERYDHVVIDNPTLRRLERFKIERHKHNYLAEIINRVNLY